ncbi:hypothetical protein [Ensifer sp. SSB1]|jgi:hypothetical protein|uniref:hypothetical protein n=1 Tax=Ensifer sp. SSB1 TaxID=2795385 RepID=UPI001A3D769F|nr:hypothetical protein [Ensifer sp. SSB1]MBK5568624.1 hypothetical protein [Ensifer sp. SSB1]
MALMHLGRARLAMVLPRHPKQLRETRDDSLFDLFEGYALASSKLDDLLREVPRQEDLLTEYQETCADLQVEVVALLTLLNERVFR